MFIFAGHTDGGSRKLKKVLLADSQTVQVGDAIEMYTTGKATLATAAHHIGGFIQSFVDKNGMPFPHDAIVAGTASGNDVATVATSTGGDKYAIVDFSRESLYSAAVSGTLGTTASSDLPGCHIDVNSANTEYGEVLETTATRTEGVEANLYSHGVDPADSSRLLVSIAMGEKQTVTT